MASVSWAAKTEDSMFSGELEPEKAQDFFKEAEKTSIVQRVAQKVPMGPTGVEFPHWNGNVQAGWVDEAEMKPITKGDFTKKTFKPKKIAAIFVVSAEVVRANPHNYIETMRSKIGEAFALKFDEAVLFGGDSPFGAYVNQTTKIVSLADTQATAGNQTNVYDSLNNGLGLLVADGKKWRSTLLDESVEPLINGSKDAQGRPLFLESEYSDVNGPFRIGRTIGRPTILSDHLQEGNVVGFMGDFSQILWGQVGGFSYDVTDQATLNVGTEQSPNFVSLWQNNLVAVRIETEYAALVNDPAAFVRLTNATLPTS